MLILSCFAACIGCDRDLKELLELVGTAGPFNAGEALHPPLERRTIPLFEYGAYRERARNDRPHFGACIGGLEPLEAEIVCGLKAMKSLVLYLF